MLSNVLGTREMILSLEKVIWKHFNSVSRHYGEIFICRIAACLPGFRLCDGWFLWVCARRSRYSGYLFKLVVHTLSTPEQHTIFESFTIHFKVLGVVCLHSSHSFAGCLARCPTLTNLQTLLVVSVEVIWTRIPSARCGNHVLLLFFLLVINPYILCNLMNHFCILGIELEPDCNWS